MNRLERVNFDTGIAGSLSLAIAGGGAVCIKTGCDVFIEPYDQFAHGDAYLAGDFLILRLAGLSDTPMSNRRHFTVTNADQWFDLKKTSMGQNSTLLVPARYYIPHGYDGLPEPAISPEPETPPT